MEKSEVLMPAVRRRRYTDPFKMAVVRLVRDSAQPVAQVARDLGIPDNVLYRWTVQHRQAEAHGTTRAAQRTEAEDLARQALTMAIRHRTPKAGLLHHSDRDSQYAATAYQQLLTTHGMTGSMSRRGNCWDNACVESFFGTLKRELIYHRQYRTREQATQDIVEYIEVFYNRLRRHSTLGYYPPAEFEARTTVA